MKHFNEDVLWESLGRLLTNELPADEKAELLAWLAEEPSRQQLLSTARALWGITEPHGPQRDPEAVLAAIHRQRPLVLTPRSPVKRRRVSPFIAIAATIAALVGGGLLWQAQQPDAAAPQWHEVATQAAQRASVTLSDGTSVVLAPDSRLRYTADFGAPQRDVYLEGAGYFVVVHDEQRPFRVHTRHGVAEDLGTTFVVRDYAEQEATEVVVEEGLVALGELRLNPGDLGRIDVTGHTTVEHDVDVARHAAWTRGVLAFDATPLRDIVPALERWYGVEIEVASESATTRRLMVTFNNEPLDAVMSRLALMLEMQVERRDGKYVLSPQ